MAFDTDRRVLARPGVQTAEFDAGLRAHMLRVYNYMTGGLALTGALAWFVGNTPAVFETIFGTPLVWVVMLAPLAFVFFAAFKLHSIKFSTLQILYWAYAALIGLSMATIFQVFTDISIARTFFVTAGAFAGLSLFGYTTKKSLSAWGSFLIMGVWGIVLASIVNMFIHSADLGFLISVVGVLVFAGLTAYDTQKIKEAYADYYDRETSGKIAVWGAWMLYLDFVLMFQFLLQFLGNRQ